MKNKKLFTLPCLAYFILALATQYVHAQCLNKKVEFSKEYSILVNAYPYRISQSTINRQEALFDSCIRCSAQDLCERSPYAIKAKDFVELYAIAEHMRDTCKQCVLPKKCITGLWIHFAMQDKKLIYFYEPVVLQGNRLLPAQDPLFKDTKATAGVYQYTNGFTKVMDSDWLQKRDHFFASMYVRRETGNATHQRGRYRDANGNLDNSWQADARRVFFSFQEILNFYSEKNPQEDTTQNYYCNSIYINNFAGEFRRVPADKPRVKNTVYITVDEGSGSPTKEALTVLTAIASDGADLAHVCPANCDNLGYPSLEKAQKYKTTKEKVE